jgi:hypothetical protein
LAGGILRSQNFKLHSWLVQEYNFFLSCSFLGWGETESTWYVGH